MGVLGYVKDLPFGELKRAVHFIRRQWFSRTIPQAPGLLIDEDAEWLEGYLKENYQYERVDKYSFHFDLEVANIRTPYGLNEDQEQLENHIRLFNIEHEKWESFCLVHLEKSRFQHWHDHVNSIGMSWDDGIDITSNVMDELGLDYKEVRTSEAYKEYHNGEVPDRFKE